MLLYKRHAGVAKKDEHTSESELREQPRGSCLEKEDNEERELCVEKKNRKERVKCYHL